jgi:hypothetical protein
MAQNVCLGREGHALRVFERKVLRTIFGRKRQEITEDKWKLHNKGTVHGLNQSWRLRCELTLEK